jgi:phosphoribosylamine---glycine ligase
MRKYNVACAASETFTSETEAAAYLDRHGAPVVIKADGLAAGKGVTVAATLAEAHAALTDIMDSGRVGSAGKKIVIEDYLEGIEISVLAAVCVTPASSAATTAAAGTAVIVPFVPARDHKRLKDGAKGPNTGGMGAVAPLSDVTPEIMKMFDRDILQPTLNGLKAEQFDYRGFIFFGVMLTSDGPKLLEYNVRLGDPETQAVLPLMDSDFAALCCSIADGSLGSFSCTWKEGFCVAPVAVSGGYPGPYRKGLPISIKKETFRQPDVHLFIAGAVCSGTSLTTSGGRVLACSAYAPTFESAWKKAYDALGSVHFEGMFYRRDIGLPGAAVSGSLL